MSHKNLNKKGEIIQMGQYHDYGIKEHIDPGVAYWIPCRCMDKKTYLTDFEKYRGKITVNRVAKAFPIGSKAWSLWFSRKLVKSMVKAFDEGKTTIDITHCFECAFFEKVSMEKTISINGKEVLEKAIENGVFEEVMPDTYRLNVMRKKS